MTSALAGCRNMEPRHMHLPLQRRLKRQLPNMHGQHPGVAIGLRIIFTNVIGLLLGDHACAGAMPLSWSTETVLAVTVDYLDGVAQTFTVEQVHQRKGLRAGGV